MPISLGYAIPKGASMITNLYAVHRQKDLWPAPDSFDPEANFVRRRDPSVSEGADGESEQSNAVEVVRTENLVPFGVGRRQCLGESLARQELFLFLVGLLQHFLIVPDPSYPLPSIHNCVPGLVRKPLPFLVRFEKC